MGFLTWSCQLLFLHHFLLHSLTHANLCSYDQSSALLQFKQLFSFDEPPSDYCIGVHSYPKMEYWKEGTDCCSWDGVTCNTVTGHVIGLDLSCSWLYGSIPPNGTLFLLSHLQTLNLAFNNFHSSQISSDFALLSSLTHLNLSNSYFTGQVPIEISYLSRLVSLDLSSEYVVIGHLEFQASVMEGLVQNLTELKVLNLDNANMSAVVPASLTNLSSSLTYLSLSFCRLHGSFPESIFQLPHLQVLDLSYNFELTCAFPELNWSNPLTTLDVFLTGFSGVLPDSISNLMSLTYLSLGICQFVGSVPTSLGNLTHLVYLDLSDNNFSGNILSSLLSLRNLHTLDLFRNNFSGNIPSSLSDLRNLHKLDLFYNNFSGNIPSSLLSLGNLHFLDLSHNNFTGKIPNVFVNFTQHVSVNGSADPILSQVGVLQNLVSINLNDNSLSGTIPSMLFNLPLLEAMDLSSNYLTGQIDEFHKYSLNIIDLSNNRLHGSIPNSLFELVNLTILKLSSNKLNGSLELDKFTKLKDLEWLDLSHNNLSLRDTIKGNSSFESILRIQNTLKFLDFSDNKMHGQMPNWMWHGGKYSLVYLNLSHNSLIGGIDQLSWTSLEYLDLSSNLLQGSVPVPPPTLRFFSISNNQLTGEIPHSICNANNIQILTLSSNRLSGTIPECIGSFSRELEILDMRSNRFGGSIPNTFAEKNNLRTLNFNNNGFEGPIPRSLANCTYLVVLGLGNNKLNGTFPYWLGDLKFLQVLDLRSNKLHGHVEGAHAMFPFSMLTILDISNNNFIGPFPTSLIENLEAMMNVDEAEGEVMEHPFNDPFIATVHYHDSVMVTIKGANIQLEKILTTFTTIDFSSNNFHGKIPESIGKLQSLRLLNLSRNSLIGHIPSSIGNLTTLESLDLSSNKLVGAIPREIARLNFLGKLNLSRNQLSGPIPRDRHLDTFGNDSYRDNLGLCGFPLLNDCQRDETLEPPPLPEDEGESEFGFGWKVVLMGYGCGIVPGLAMGYLVFSTGKPKWLVRFVEKEHHRVVRRPNNRRRGRKN